MDRRKLVTLLVVLFTVVLAGVAVFTAVRLYQQQDPIAPTAPTSIPRAQEATPTPAPSTTSCSPVTFALGAPVCGDTCSPSNSSSCPQNHTCSTTTNKCILTACAVAGTECDTTNCTVTPEVACGGTCTTTSQCPNDHTCSSGKCVLSTCLQSGVSCNSTNCSVTTAPPPPPAAAATPTPAPELPSAGTDTPTIIGGILGILAIIGALALAL